MNSVCTRRRNAHRIVRSVVVDGHETTLWIEPVFWGGLEEIARRERTTTGRLLSLIVQRCPPGANFHSGIRCFVVAYYRHIDQSLPGTEGIELDSLSDAAAAAA